MYKRIIYGLVILYTVAPILSVCVVAVIAGVCGCKVDEGGPHPCIIFGMDIGPLLCQMGVLGWLMFVTVPSGLFVLSVLNYRYQRHK
jgi:membrane-associated phospholipid phosphatase